MKRRTTRGQQILALVKRKGVLRPRDLDARGIPREYLSRLERHGLVRRVARGLYRLPDVEPTEHYELAHLAARVPEGVICLLSALAFHELTTQLPREIWLAIAPKARAPRITWPPLRIMRFSGPAFTEGREQHVIEGVIISVYSPAKTVADCFKFRNKIGLDVAIEALRDCLRERKATITELTRYARTCRVWEVMRPYIEALVYE